MEAAGRTDIVRPVAAAGDHQMRDTGLGGRCAKHRRQRLRLAFIDNQQVGMWQQPGGHPGIKGRGAVGKLQPAVPRGGDKCGAAVCLVLKKRPVTFASLIKPGIGQVHVDIVIRAGEQQDLVLAIDRHRHDRMAGGKFAVLNGRQIHPGIAHFGTQPFIFGVGSTDMAHVGAGAGQGDRLVRPLAAKGPLMLKRCQCLARRRKMRHLVDQIDIDGAKVEDSHAKSSRVPERPVQGR